VEQEDRVSDQRRTVVETIFDNCISSERGECFVFSRLLTNDEDQATKGVRRMPRRKQAKKDVASCDKLRGAAKQALIRRFPNGETRHD
jgi:hypothetical protein